MRRDSLTEEDAHRRVGPARDLTRLNHALAFGSELAEWTEGVMRRV